MKSCNILELMRAVEPHRNQVRLITPRGSQETSFADLWSASSRMGRAIKMAVAQGRVAGFLTPSAEMIASFVGCLRAGRDFVSLPLRGRGQDLAAYAQQLQSIVDICNVGAILVEAAYAGLIESLPLSPKLPVIVVERLGMSTTDSLRTDDAPGELIQFSSGTTGTPKGVRLDGTAIAASVEATLAALRIGDRPEVFCHWVPLSHDMGLIGGLFLNWVAATRTPYVYVCMSPELFMARPLSWMEACAANGATITTAPTFGYEIVARQLARAPLLDLNSLRAAVVGAEPIGKDTLATFAAVASRHGFREIALCPAYGLAEATLAVSILPPDEPWSSRIVSVDGERASYVSCGRILDCVQVMAPDVELGAALIKIAGPAVCSGHLPPRDRPADGWLDTGDLGVLSESELVVTGRLDDLLCVAGRNFFAWELERAACTLHHVRAGACAVVHDRRGGYVALFEPQATDKDENLQDALAAVRHRLVTVAGIGPSAIACIPRGTLPKTPSGKLRRNGISANLRHFIDSSISYKEF